MSAIPLYRRSDNPGQKYWDSRQHSERILLPMQTFSYHRSPPPPSSMLTMRKLQYSPIRDNRLFSTLYRGAGICPSLFWPGLSERLYKCIGGMGYGCTPV